MIGLTDRVRPDRELARALRKAAPEAGVTTLIPFHSALLDTPQWAAGETCRDLVEDQLPEEER